MLKCQGLGKRDDSSREHSTALRHAPKQHSPGEVLTNGHATLHHDSERVKCVWPNSEKYGRLISKSLIKYFKNSIQTNFKQTCFLFFFNRH